jgi:type I restriction enzyme M protein
MIPRAIFANTNYGDSLFSTEEVSAVEQRIAMRDVKGKPTPYITCFVRNKEIKMTPEEVVRQLYLYRLMNSYGYPVGRNTGGVCRKLWPGSQTR